MSLIISSLSLALHNVFLFFKNIGPFDNTYRHGLLALSDRKSILIHKYICIGLYNLFLKPIKGLTYIKWPIGPTFQKNFKNPSLFSYKSYQKFYYSLLGFRVNINYWTKNFKNLFKTLR
jgi:hypothetical protein